MEGELFLRRAWRLAVGALLVLVAIGALEQAGGSAPAAPAANRLWRGSWVGRPCRRGEAWPSVLSPDPESARDLELAGSHR